MSLDERAGLGPVQAGVASVKGLPPAGGGTELQRSSAVWKHSVRKVGREFLGSSVSKSMGERVLRASWSSAMLEGRRGLLLLLLVVMVMVDMAGLRKVVE